MIVQLSVNLSENLPKLSDLAIYSKIFRVHTPQEAVSQVRHDHGEGEKEVRLEAISELLGAFPRAVV